jgi:ribosomal protein S18 acetylase RimI-like enzyme
MGNFHISFMEKSDIQESANILSVAMLDNPLHVAVFQGKGEKERMEIEKMFFELLTELPGIVFLAKEKQNIIGVMRMKSCQGRKVADVHKDAIDENDVGWRKSVWHREWGRHDPIEQHWHLGPIGVLPSNQGSGIGTMLMERFCREVDACHAKAYLETEGDKNVRFYEKFGFKVVRESEIMEVKNRYMLREAHDLIDNSCITL